jgi:hypothetical protein
MRSPRFLPFALLALVGALAGCGLDDDASPIGEPCTSDFDCPDDMECVPADSANASAVCMPL